MTPVWPLSRRESEVADMLCRGFNRAEIAAALGIAPKTYDTHRGNVMKGTGCRNEVELLRYGLARGVVEPIALLGEDPIADEVAA